MKDLSVLFKVSAVLWIIWGLVHILAGVMTMKGVLTGDISASVIGIADAVDPENLKWIIQRLQVLSSDNMDSTCYGSGS